MQDKLNEHLQALRPSLGPADLPRQAEQLKHRLGSDSELLAEVSNLVPEDGYRVLVDPVEAFLERL